VQTEVETHCMASLIVHSNIETRYMIELIVQILMHGNTLNDRVTTETVFIMQFGIRSFLLLQC
jgi:hypothetical protein